ncbi:glycosyltransferase [Maridesulfovibrio bastinii]|uniref:glycosyltransferase n=1 Tax=Maridesulfovibrio bastinii TaxID=47157 RepID=UPI00146FB63D|nr:glycosyltransferase [Maridesulfovibrio bastinii]
MTKIKIIMVHVDPCIRVLKQVSALKTRGVSVDLLCTTLKNNPSIKEHVDNVYYYSNLYNLRSFLENNYTNWDIIHCHNEPNSHIEVAINVCKHRPVIYDCHDMTSMRTNVTKVEEELEEYCFKRSAAVIHVSEGIKKYASQKYGRNLSIVLPSFPSSSQMTFKRKNKVDGNHMVYLGGIVNNPDTKYSYRYYLPMFKAICDANIHLHVFPAKNAPWNLLKEYTNTFADNSYFHCHTPLPYNKLIEEISQFQWGFSGFNLDYITSKQTINFLHSALPNKFFDYLLAGVCPVVINNNTAAEFAIKYKLGYQASNIENLVEICRDKKPYSPIEDTGIIDMNVQIDKLIAVYQAVLKDTEKEQEALTFSYETQPKRNINFPIIPFLNLKSNDSCHSILQMLLQYYTSGVWLHKEENCNFSHTSCDTHAFYLSSFNKLYLSGNKEVISQIRQIADLLLGLNNQNYRGNFGWGLGAPYVNRLNSNKKNPPVNPSNTCYTYTSSMVCLALLEAFEITGEQRYLTACTKWRESFFKNIGFHSGNDCCLYADNESYRIPEPIFIPNVTPLFMGFLSEYSRVSKSTNDHRLIQRLGEKFIKLKSNGNWTYSTGATEDLLHLGMIAEGFYLSKDILKEDVDTSSIITSMIDMMFYDIKVNLTPVCLGSSNWGPAWALYAFLLHNAPKEYIAAGIDFLANNPQIMLYNIRTASLYARFFSKL